MSRGKGRKPGRARISGRNLHTRVKTAKGRKASSTRWLGRQLNDPYVAQAKREGYRSRAAFKLIELDDKFRILKKGGRVVDLGAAPGGWTQVAVEKTGGGGKVVAIDVEPMEPIQDAEVMVADIEAAGTPAAIEKALGGAADAVLSDMAPKLTGHASTDHLRTMALVEAAYALAREVLAPGGAFVAKVFRGGTEAELLADMKRHFKNVRHAKPPASRSESAEIYVVATGFRDAD